jgi:hypothetical protein
VTTRTLVKQLTTRAPTVDPRRVAIDAIVRETHCSRDLASSTLRWIEDLVVEARKSGQPRQYPSSAQMHSEQYGVFEQVMPHGTIAAPGSAHAAIEAAVLDPSRDEFGLRHENRDDATAARTYCHVTVEMSVLH